MRRTLAAAALIVVAAAVALVSGGSARGANASGCPGHACVVLIEVNGLTPHDVTPQNTPFMWALAHPDEPASPGVPNAILQPQNGTPRAGWIWQAARGVMSTSDAAASASLLTGSYPDKSGVAADEYAERSSSGLKWFSLDGDGLNGGSLDDALHLSGISGETVLSTVQENAATPGATKAYVGDPRLFDLVTQNTCSDDTVDPTAVSGWRPGAQGDTSDCPSSVTVDSTASDPALCPLPTQPSTSPSVPACPADDARTMQAATQDLTGATGQKLQMTYMYLAELGIVKQRSGDVQEALHDTDAAIASYVATFVQEQPARWNDTVLMVVGNHGYESTPIAQRVPDPKDPSKSLIDYIKEVGGDKVDVVPQGTLADVYYTGDNPAERDQVLADIRHRVLEINGSASQCNPPQEDAPAGASRSTPGPCIDDVLYTNPNTADGGTANTVAAKHPTWHMGDDPDEVVLTGRGWAAAPATPEVDTTNTGADTLVAPGNPYSASDGGPRDRAIAALVDGPASLMFQLRGPSADGTWDGRAPVTQGPATASDVNTETPRYQTVPANQNPEPPVDQANGDPSTGAPGDDAGAVGHEQQPETVDFAPTIAALMQVQPPADQLDGNVIQTPFRATLAIPSDDEDLGQSVPDVVIQQAPQIIQPPAPKTYDFHGLVRNLRARVGTLKGLHFIPANRARAGTRLDYIDVSADFGKPLSKVTLTLYRRTSAGRAHASRSRRHGGRKRLVTLVRFMPFTVQRAPGVELRFKVPPQYSPSAIGVLVQQAVKVKPKPAKPGAKPQPNFRGTGPVAGGIVTIRDAGMLHRKVARHRHRHAHRHKGR